MSNDIRFSITNLQFTKTIVYNNNNNCQLIVH